MPGNVVKPKVYVISLKHPLNWGGKMVNVMFLLALNFNNVTTTKAFFSDFARIVGSEEKLEKFKKLDNVQKMEQNLKEELHWE